MSSPPDARIPCLVIGCKRTHAGRRFQIIPEGEKQYICGFHWTPVPSNVKAVLRRIRVQARRVGWTPCLTERFHRAWRKAAKIAIEKSVGIR